jgi:hypothetical protein
VLTALFGAKTARCMKVELLPIILATKLLWKVPG